MSVNADNLVYQASLVSINNENGNHADSQDSETFVCLDIFSKGFVQVIWVVEFPREVYKIFVGKIQYSKLL